MFGQRVRRDQNARSPTGGALRGEEYREPGIGLGSILFQRGAVRDQCTAGTRKKTLTHEPKLQADRFLDKAHRRLRALRV